MGCVRNESIYESLVNIVLRCHVVVERLQFGERQLLHRVFNHADEFFAAIIACCFKAMKICHRW